MRIDAIILRELHMELVRPFQTSFGVTHKRRILLAEVHSEGLIGWGECTAGERPFFSAESTESAWQTIVQELGPTLAAASPQSGGDCPKILRHVRANRMAKATLENAIWDLDAQREGISLAQLLGGRRQRQRGRTGSPQQELELVGHTSLHRLIGSRRLSGVGSTWCG